MILQVHTTRHRAEQFADCRQEDVGMSRASVWLYRLGPGADFNTASCEQIVVLWWRDR